MIAFALIVLLNQAAESAASADAEGGEKTGEQRAEIDKAFAEETPRQVRVTLNDGRVISGRLLMRDDLQMLVETENGDPVHIDVEDVQRYVEPLGNKNRSRYLFAGSALMPDEGQVSLTQVQVLATLFEVGVSKNFSFQLGTAVPAYFLGADGINAYAAVKAGTSFTKYVHLALDLKVLAVGALARAAGSATAVPAAALAAVTITFGTEDLNLTVTAGPPFVLSELTRANGRVVGLPAVALSGFARVHNNVGLITENWLIPEANPTDKQWFVADSLAARFFGERWAIDLGIVVLPMQFVTTSPVPGVLPWLNFTFHFT